MLCAGLAVAALGPWGAVPAIPLGFAGAYLLIHALPVIGLAARTTPAILGTTLIRSRRVLPESVEWELFRAVDLVKGRLWGAAPGVECGTCEVWVVRRASEVALLLRSSRVGVGLVGAPICALREDEAAEPVAALKAISRGIARNAAGSMRCRAGTFLWSGLHEYLLACARAPQGPRRRERFHREAWLAVTGGSERPDGILLGELLGTGRSGRGPLARSFTAFLVGRYGWPAYLRLLRHADSRSPSVALHLTYGRTPAELERRWLVFLESVQTGQAAGEECA